MAETSGENTTSVPTREYKPLTVGEVKTDKNSYFSTVMDTYTEDYSKDSGSKSGDAVASQSKFKSKVKEVTETVNNGNFFKKRGIKLGKLSGKNLKGFLDAVSSVDSMKALTKGKITGLFKDVDLTSGSKVRNLGLGALMDTLGGLEAVGGALLSKFGGFLLSFLVIPDQVYLATLIALDKAGSDLEANDWYIRKVILKRDITCALEWWNKEWDITYSGLSDDAFYSDPMISARSGAFKNVKLILDEMYSNYNELMTLYKAVDTTEIRTAEDNVNKIIEELKGADASKPEYIVGYMDSRGIAFIEDLKSLNLGFIGMKVYYTDATYSTMSTGNAVTGFFRTVDSYITQYDTINEKFKVYKTVLETAKDKYELETIKYLDPANQIYNYILTVMKNTIVCGFSGFTVKELKKLMDAYNIKPCWFGDNDETYRKRYRISEGDIDIIAPFYRPVNKGALATIATISKISSRFRKERTKRNQDSESDSWFIDPRNKQIKRLYLLLADEGTYGTKDSLIHKNLANRLKHKITTVWMEALDEGLAGLLPKQVTDFAEGWWNAAYAYTKEVEPFLVNPATWMAIKLADTDVITDPRDYVPSTPTTKIKSAIDIIKDMLKLLLKYKIITENSITGNYPTKVSELDELIDPVVSGTDTSTVIGEIADDSKDPDFDPKIVEEMIIDKIKGDIYNYIDLNIELIYSTLIQYIKNNTYTTEVLNTTSLADLQKLIKSELIASGLYTQVQNNSDDLLKLKLMMSEMQSTINGVISGTIKIQDIKTLTEYITIINNRIDSGDVNVEWPKTQITIVNTNIINQINNFIYDGKDFLGGKSFEQLLKEMEALTNDGKTITNKMQDMFNILTIKINDIITKIDKGISVEIKTINDILDEIQEELDKKIDLTDITKVLKEMGVENIEDYIDELKDLVDANKKLKDVDPDYYDFDVTNPTKKTIESVRDEAINGDGFVKLEYMWVGHSKYGIPVIRNDVGDITNMDTAFVNYQ